MPNGKKTVLLSSTILDLKDLRSDLAQRLTSSTLRVQASELGNLPVDSQEHSYESCLKAAKQCDILVAIIDGRFGGLMPDGHRSITLAEIETALDAKKQVFVFVRQSVWDAKEIYKLYLQEGAPFIPSKIIADDRVLHIIDNIRKRKSGNWIFLFNSAADIASILYSQLDNDSVLPSYSQNRSNLASKKFEGISNSAHNAFQFAQTAYAALSRQCAGAFNRLRMNRTVKGEYRSSSRTTSQNDPSPRSQVIFYIRVRFLNAFGPSFTVPAQLDTGFTGDLLLSHVYLRTHSVILSDFPFGERVLITSHPGGTSSATRAWAELSIVNAPNVTHRRSELVIGRISVLVIGAARQADRFGSVGSGQQESFSLPSDPILLGMGVANRLAIALNFSRQIATARRT